MSGDSSARLTAALADRYRIERELGGGGMATVYLAHDIRHDRDVALKVLRHDIAQTVGAERFLREIRLAAKLNHPNILALFDSGDADGALFYVMPSAEGQSLRDRLNTTPKLPIDEAVRIATEVAGALDYAHRNGVVHRDIKPENIMLQDGHAMVADFGIGKAMSDVAGDTLTQVGMSVGTPAYMSPEQAVGEAVDGRSDIYSLGCMLYEMLVGEQPFTGPTVQAVIAKRFVQTPVEVTALREGVPRPVALAVQRAMARTPVDRYETAGALISAMRAAASAGDGSALRASPQSIAVLPLDNLSADKENEYFGDGIAEDIINALTQIDGLHVAARTSSFSFKGKQESLAVIGEKLNVATVLQGSVRKSGNRLRISAQLVSVADGFHLWSERYDRDLTDMFVVQDEIAGAIAAKLQLTFVTPAEPAAKLTSVQAKGYEWVARGRTLLSQRGRAALEARECFERAIAIDPLNAAAYAGLGDTIRVLIQYGYCSATDGVPLAKAALTRALEIEPELAFAMASMATIALNYDRDPARSFELLERALQIDPRLHEFRVLYATFLLIILRRDDVRGLAELDRAVREDPLSGLCASIRAVGLSISGHHEEAKAEAIRAVGLDPQAFVAHAMGTWAHAWADDTEGALAFADRGMQSFGRHPWILMILPGVYMQRGDQRRAEAVFTELTARAETSYVSQFSLAVAALGLGLIDEGVEYALKSAELTDAVAPIWARSRLADLIRDHPKYPQLLRLMGL